MSAVEYKYFHYGTKETEHLAVVDPVLGEAMVRLGHVKRQVIPDPFAALINGIIGQLISTRAAKTVWERMQEHLGEITPENLSGFTPEEVKQCGITMKKAICICDLAKEIVEGNLCLDCLQKKPDNEIIRILTDFKGIGPWTAQMLLIHMERPDVVSFGDIAIRRGMEKLYGNPKLTKEQFDSYRNKYSPYGSVASIYLWELYSMSIEKKEVIKCPK